MRQERPLKRVAVLVQPCAQEFAVGLGGLGRDRTGGPEIEQHDPTVFVAPLEIGEVRVGLHEAELEQLAHHEFQQRAAGLVAQRLAFFRQGLDRRACQVVHRQHHGCHKIVDRRGQRETRVVRKQRPVAAHLLRLASVIGFFAELSFGLGQKWRDVEPGGQEPRIAQQRRDIVDIGVDAGRDARILDLDRQFAPGFQRGAVHLPDRGRRDRTHVEPREPLAPVAAPGPGQHLVELPGRHDVRLLAQPRQDRGQFRRQHVARVERDHLPQLHRRPAHPRQLIGDPARVAGRQQKVRHPGPLAPRKLAHPFAKRTGCDAASHLPERRQPRQPRLRHSPVSLGHAGAPMLAGLQFGDLLGDYAGRAATDQCSPPRGPAHHCVAAAP